MEINYSKELFKLMAGYPYKGCVITCNVGEYVALGRKCKSLEEAKTVIDDALKGLEKTIKK